MPSPRCGSSPGRVQQGYRRPASSQVLPQCPSAKVSFRVQHGPSWEWLRGYRVYHGSKGHLHPFYPGSQGLLFCSHEGGGSQEGLPGYFHSAVTSQSCSAPWRGIYWRGEKESTQLPLHLPDCLAGQPSWIPWCDGSFLLCFARTCTNISSLQHSPQSSTLPTRIHAQDFFPSHAWTFT